MENVLAKRGSIVKDVSKIENTYTRLNSFTLRYTKSEDRLKKISLDKLSSAYNDGIRFDNIDQIKDVVVLLTSFLETEGKE